MMLTNSKKNLKKPANLWEIWQDEQYLGTTDSLQIAEIALEHGLKVVRVQ